MSITTYASFVAAIAALDIDTIQRTYTYPPEALNTADLPASWVQLPVGDEPRMTLGFEGGWPTFRVQHVVAVEAVAQDRQKENFTTTVAMMDKISDALRALGPLDVCRGGIWWGMKVAVTTVAGIDYWAVATDIEGRG